MFLSSCSYRVLIMFLSSCSYHVLIVFLSCSYHVLIVFLSCSYHHGLVIMFWSYLVFLYICLCVCGSISSCLFSSCLFLSLLVSSCVVFLFHCPVVSILSWAFPYSHSSRIPPVPCSHSQILANI